MKSKSMMAFLLESIRPFHKWILAQLFVDLVWATDIVLRPYLLKLMLDRLPDLPRDQVFDQLSWLACLYMLCCIGATVNFRFYDYIWLNLNHPMKQVLARALMERLMRHSNELFQNQFAGSLGNKVKDVMSGVPDVIRIILDKFFTHLFSLTLASYVVWTVNYKFACGLVGWAILFIFGSILLTRKGSILSREAAHLRSGVVGKIVDILSNIMSVRLFTGAKYESTRLDHSLQDYVETAQKRDWYFLKVFAFQGLSFAVCQGLCLYWLIQGYSEGTISAGDFVLILTVNIAIVDHLWTISKDMSDFAELTGNITQGIRIVLSPLEIADAPHAKPLRVEKGEIIFDNIQFNYKGAEPLFENKSLVIQPCQKVGLVGYSGSGKSTFVSLILRLYDPSGGRILIDGQDISQVTQESLHHHISMIPQDPALFHRSVMENIRYGKMDASDEEVIEAAKKAHAHDFILKLPQGYSSLVGERGVKLSGGQRQRIAIARAILKDAPILILDEATSHLDSVTESDIQDSLWNLMKEKTTLVVAHRLSTLLHMDRILVFQEGSILEDGAHETLLAEENSHYRVLWNAQISGMVDALGS